MYEHGRSKTEPDERARGGAHESLLCGARSRVSRAAWNEGTLAPRQEVVNGIRQAPVGICLFRHAGPEADAASMPPLAVAHRHRACLLSGLGETNDPQALQAHLDPGHEMFAFPFAFVPL